MNWKNEALWIGKEVFGGAMPKSVDRIGSIRNISYFSIAFTHNLHILILLTFCLQLGSLFASKDDPGTSLTAIIGTATSSTANNVASPINATYKSLHGQAIYKASEFQASGISSPMKITQLGFYIQTAPAYALPNFKIRMKHSSSLNVSTWQDNNLLQTVYHIGSYSPVAGGFHMLNLSTPFIWNGVDNLVVDTSFDCLSATSNTGTTRYSGLSNGYRYCRSDHADQAEVFSGGYVNSSRPNMRFVFSSLSPNPELQIFPELIDMGRILADTSNAREFAIFNGGNQDLIGNLSYPAWLWISEIGSEQIVDSYTIPPGKHKIFTCHFNSAVLGLHLGAINISHNFLGEPRQIAFEAEVYNPTSTPYVDGYEGEAQNWEFANTGNTNKWCMGSATSNSGNSSIYISNNLGQSHAYTINRTSIVHAFCDFLLPSSAIKNFLRFSWKAGGEGAATKLDYLQVSIADIDYVPMAGFKPSGATELIKLNGQTDWTTANLTLPESMNGSEKRLIFTWVNDASSGTQPPAAIDNIRILQGANSEAVAVLNGSANIIAPTVSNPDAQNITASVQISDITQGDGMFISSYYDSGMSGFASAGLELIFSGVNFAGTLVEIYHGLGFTPSQMAWRIAYGSWNILSVSHPEALVWNSELVSFRLPSKAEGDLEVVFADSEDSTLPLELSSFSASYMASSGVKLLWVTASETALSGYQVIRSETNNLKDAISVSDLIVAENSSQGAQYSFLDISAEPNSCYFYWLKVYEFGGETDTYGAVMINTYHNMDNELPEIPFETNVTQIFPNPFNPNTTIRYSLNQPAVAKFSIYNPKGQLVRSYVQNHAQAGYYSLAFEGKDAEGYLLGSGLYFVRMEVVGKQYLRKMVLLK